MIIWRRFLTEMLPSVCHFPQIKTPFEALWFVFLKDWLGFPLDSLEVSGKTVGDFVVLRVWDDELQYLNHFMNFTSLKRREDLAGVLILVFWTKRVPYLFLESSLLKTRNQIIICKKIFRRKICLPPTELCVQNAISERNTRKSA